MEAETKRVKTKWGEKTRGIFNENFIFELQKIDDAFLACDEALAEVGMSVGYESEVQSMREILYQLDTLWTYVYRLKGYVEEKIEEPLYESFVNKATEGLSRIKSEDFEVDVSGTSVEITEEVTYRHKDVLVTKNEKKNKLSFGDFLGTKEGTADSGNRRITLNSVPGFAEIFACQYEALKSQMTGADGQELTKLEYLTELETMGEFVHYMDKPGLSFLSGLLDITILKPIIEAFTGEDLITKEDLSDAERTLKVAFAILDVVTIGQAMAVTNVSKLAGKEAVLQFGKVAVIELGTNATGYVINSVGEKLELPTWLTLMLSIGGASIANRALSNSLLNGQSVKVNWDSNSKGGSEIPTAFRQTEFASSYDARINQTPSLTNRKVQFVGDRGESLCVLKPPPDPELERLLNEAGVDGILYRNAVPDFSPVSRAEVEIDYMLGGNGANGNKARDLNFQQANAKLAEKLNESPELAQAFGMEAGNIKVSDIEKYRVKNDLTWHELNDGRTVQLVPSEINSSFGHLGGVGEINAGIYKK